MNILVYWATYWTDYNPHSARDHVCETGYRSDQGIMGNVAKGDRAWVVGRSEDDEEWRLLQRLTIDRVDIDGEGAQRMVANRQSSLFFDPSNQDDFEAQLRLLQFDPKWPIDNDGAMIGQNIQAIRRLGEEDTELLDNYAARLATLANH